MKKILLLSALFGGFVLNNGYCYDENNKLTMDDADKKSNQFDLEDFAKDLLNSTIDRKRVVDLLYQKKLNAEMLQKICDDSLGSKISVSDNVIILALSTYTTIKITLHTDKASNNVLAAVLDPKNEILYSNNFSVYPSRGFGEASRNIGSFEAYRLQRNQDKKAQKAEKKNGELLRQSNSYVKKTMEQFIGKKVKIVEGINKFIRSKNKNVKENIQEHLDDSLKQLAIWFIKGSRLFEGPDNFLKQLQKNEIIFKKDILKYTIPSEEDSSKSVHLTRVKLFLGKKLPFVSIKIKENEALAIGYSKTFNNQGNHLENISNEFVEKIRGKRLIVYRFDSFDNLDWNEWNTTIGNPLIINENIDTWEVKYPAEEE